MDIGNAADWCGGVNCRIIGSFVWGPALEISQCDVQSGLELRSIKHVWQDAFGMGLYIRIEIMRQGQVVTGSVSEDFRLLEIKHNPLSRSIDPRFSTANIGGGTRVKR